MYTDTDGYITKSVYIIKAANSIHTVVSDKVFGFRMGGDEYVMVAVNITEDEAQKIREKWEKSLETLNDEGDVYCVMACGLEYGSGEFNYDELYHRADAQMYLDKKTKKENCQTSHVK